MYKINFIHRLLSLDFNKLRLEFGNRDAGLVLVVVFCPISIFNFDFCELLAVLDGVGHPSSSGVKVDWLDTATVEGDDRLELSGICFGESSYKKTNNN